MSGLTSSRMRRLIVEAAATFDWVIIDTPPVVLLPDANLLAAMVDAAILVIGAPARRRTSSITRAVDALGRNRILGVDAEPCRSVEPGRRLRIRLLRLRRARLRGRH